MSMTPRTKTARMAGRRRMTPVVIIQVRENSGKVEKGNWMSFLKWKAMRRRAIVGVMLVR
jgi:hypothetical protein